MELFCSLCATSFIDYLEDFNLERHKILLREDPYEIGHRYFQHQIDQWINFNGGISYKKEISPQVWVIWYSLLRIFVLCRLLVWCHVLVIFNAQCPSALVEWLGEEGYEVDGLLSNYWWWISIAQTELLSLQVWIAKRSKVGQWIYSNHAFVYKKNVYLDDELLHIPLIKLS